MTYSEPIIAALIMQPMPWSNVVALLGMLAFFSFVAWLMFRADGDE